MGRNTLFIFLALAIIFALFFGGRYILLQKGSGEARLKVTSTPTASIFLDSRNIGRTPYEDKLEPGEYTLKLIPEGSSEEAATWQAKLHLGHNLLTYVNRELGKSELTSAGEVLQLEKISDRLSEITIHSTPDGASVKLDNIDRGTASLSIKNVEGGNHVLDVSAPGSIGRTIKIKTTPEYRLVVQMQLAIGNEKSATDSAQTTHEQEPTPAKTKPTPGGKPLVKILNTPTSFLRVRNGPSTSDEEIGRVKPGETYPLLEEKSGWYSIQYKPDESGWIASRYAEKIQ